MKRRRKILIAVGVFLVLMAASLTVTMHVQPQHEVEAYKKMLRDKGEKLEISEVLPPPVPDESNGVALVESALGLLPANSNDDCSNLPPAMQMIDPGKAIVGWAQPDLRWMGYDAFTDSWEHAQATVNAERPAMDLLKQASDFPALDFHLDYKSCFETPVQYLEPLKHSNLILEATTMCDLHNHDAASATTNLCILLSLEQKDGVERNLMSQEVRLAMAAIALRDTWELLQSTNATDMELARLQACWQQQDYFAGAEGAALMERAWMERLIETLRVSYSDFNRLMPGGVSSSSGFSSTGKWLEDAKGLASSGAEYATLTMWQKSWSFDDEKRMLQKYQIMLDAIRAARTNQAVKPVFDRMTSQLATMELTNSPATWTWDAKWPFSEYFSGPFPTGKFTRAEVSRKMAVTAIALKRFQLNHGIFPEKLAELSPKYVLSVPLDPVDGKPLRYRRNEDGTYLLYSIGEDGVDDGGDVTPAKVAFSSTPNWNWQRARDWVWPQPATAEEVKSFFDGQAAKAAAEAAAKNGPLDPITGLPVPAPPP